MSNNIEALMADMKAAAEKATPGQWVFLPKNTSIEYDVGSDESQGSICYMDSGDFTQRITELNGLHVAAANPENVLKLIAALEQSHTEREEFRHRLKLERSILEDADKRIAELQEQKDKWAAWAVSLGAKADELEASALCVKPTDAMREVAPLCVKLPDGFGPAVTHVGQQSITYKAIMSVKGGWLHKDMVIEAIRAAGGKVTNE